jgi:phosphoglycerol transferase MdoB-like AlkP superfamily enzyme
MVQFRASDIDHMRFRAILVFAAVISLPLLAEAAGAPRTFKDLASLAYTLIMFAVGTLITLALVYYFWNIADSLRKEGEGSYTLLRNYAGWGLIILFLMVSVFGIVRIISSTFFQGEGAAPGLNNSKNGGGALPSLIDAHVISFDERNV